MKRTKWLTLAGLGVAGLLVAAPAEARDAKKSGVVSSLDRGNMQIKLAESPAVLVVGEDTEIRRDGRRATLADVREGDEVRASYSGSGDSLTVKKLEVTSRDPFHHPSHDGP